MEDFRAYVYTREMTFGNIPVNVQATFPHIKCESKDEAETLAKLLVRAFNLFPEDFNIWMSIAAENKPASNESEREEG